MSAFDEWKETGLNDERKAVALVAEGLTNAANRNLQWWQRKRHPMDAVPLAREAVAVLLLLPEGRELSRRILAASQEERNWSDNKYEVHPAITTPFKWQGGEWPKYEVNRKQGGLMVRRTARDHNSLVGFAYRLVVGRLARRLDPRSYARLDRIVEKNKLLWKEHLSRCECHDSWDQCPCVEEGHAAPGLSWRGRYCACCRWCSPPSGKQSPFVEPVRVNVEEEGT